MGKFRYAIYVIYTIIKYLITTKAIPLIKDTFSNIVTIYVAVISGLTAGHFVFPNQSIILLNTVLGNVNTYHLIWILLAIGVFQLILKHKKYVVTYTSNTNRWLKAIHSASLESSALTLLIVGSIIQLSTLFLPTGIVLAEAIAFVFVLRIYWITRNKWIYSTIRLQ
ncbi:MAG: hypothetical protein KGH89_03280 [Thaumarchaeota archaeon]|nr:hypothetical protein [Nitrososphaerota archaeon]MDE1862006.1 hypothetical protein [Nitrososphaerota archaeon]